MVSNLNADLLDGYRAADINTRAPAPHAILGTSHSDTTVGTVLRSNPIIGQGVTAAWTRLGEGEVLPEHLFAQMGQMCYRRRSYSLSPPGKTLTANRISLTLNALPVGGLAVATPIP